MEEYIRTQRDDAARGIAHGAARKSAKDAGPLVPDYTLLHRRLRARGLSQRSVSRMIGVSESHFCRKLSGLYDFTQEDIRLLCGLLSHFGGVVFGHKHIEYAVRMSCLARSGSLNAQQPRGLDGYHHVGNFSLNELMLG